MTKEKKFNDWRDGIRSKGQMPYETKEEYQARVIKAFCKQFNKETTDEDQFIPPSVKEIKSLDEMSFGIEELENIAAETEKRTERIFRDKNPHFGDPAY